MRLTLRTLLAYLDDTLEPSEIRQIGQKVSESDAAQELIARLKQVTRRRRLTTPPATGPNSFDPNTVAEYLDNELTNEQVAEVEKLCLESDVHLAEIATCHQILTLVLGEPALVPPTAKERMYGLVQGREAIPFRKATAPAAPHHAGVTTAPLDATGDEMLLLGLPFYRRSSWLRWGLPVAAVILLAALGWALYQALPGIGGGSGPVAAVDTSKPAATEKSPATSTEEKPAEPRKESDKVPPPEGVARADAAAGNKEKSTNTQTEVKKESSAAAEPRRDAAAGTAGVTQQPAGAVQAASKERVATATYVADRSGLPSILVQRDAEGTDGWRRLKSGAHVYTSDRLVSLPGYGSEVRTDSNVRLLLQGLMREFARLSDPAAANAMSFLLESAVVLHKNPHFDADLTLDRGRLYITNIKDQGPAKIRLRFGRDAAEVWDVTLQEPGAEVVMDLTKSYTPDTNYQDGEDPQMNFFFMLLRGTATVKIDYDTYTMNQPSGLRWNNKTGRDRNEGPQPIPADLPIWKRPPPDKSENPLAEEMIVAVKELATKMVDERKAPSLVLEEILHGSDTLPSGRRLAIYCMGSLDEVRRLVDTLADEDPNHVAERQAAIFTLQRWIGRDANHSKSLYDPKTQAGLLRDGQKYRSGEAKTLFILLHDFSWAEQQNRETYELLANYMVSDKVAIAELAYWHLRGLAQGVPLPPFNAAAPVEDRKPVAAQILKLIADNKLPPRPQGSAPPASPGGGKSKPPR